MKESKKAQIVNVSDKTVGEIVADDYRTAKVFEKHGIDFCCGDKVALSATCTKKEIDLATIMGELVAIKNEPVERSQNFASWELPFLADYIINAHHTYLKENTGQIAALHRFLIRSRKNHRGKTDGRRTAGSSCVSIGA